MQLQASEHGLLHHAIRRCLTFVRWRRRPSSAGARLAYDLGLQEDVVSRVLDEVAADLRKLAAKGDAADARPAINKAVNELAKFGFCSRPFDTEAMDRCLKQLAEPDLAILRHFKEGMKHAEIAALMGTDVPSVRRSLVRTYADLRIKMMGWDDDDGAPVAHTRHKRVRAWSWRATSSDSS
jgi:DNA-directed RNA polymerase specialized sigma24 family protein